MPAIDLRPSLVEPRPARPAEHPAAGADWAAIDWSLAERDNFSFFRRHSNEPDVLARATHRAALESRIRPANATVLDFGCDGHELSARLAKLFKRYVQVPIDCDAAADRYLTELRGPDGSTRFDICLMSHVLPYVTDAELTMRTLAATASIRAIGTAILLDSSGDQYEIGQLARACDPSYPRKHDHGDSFAAFLEARGVPFESFTVTSEARVATARELARVVAFFLGTVPPELLAEVAGRIARRADSGHRLTSNHRVFSWRLRDLSD